METIVNMETIVTAKSMLHPIIQTILYASTLSTTRNDPDTSSVDFVASKSFKSIHGYSSNLTTCFLDFNFVLVISYPIQPTQKTPPFHRLVRRGSADTTINIGKSQRMRQNGLCCRENRHQEILNHSSIRLV